MGYRPGDEVETFEAKIEHKSKASYLVEMTLGGRYFVPFSQIADMSEPDENGNREFTVAKWWWDRKTPVDDDPPL